MSNSALPTSSVMPLSPPSKKRFAASFAEPELSSDNAVGIAALAARAYRRGTAGKENP